MLCQRTSLSVQAEANTSQVPLWKEKTTHYYCFPQLLTFLTNSGPRVLVVQLQHQRNQSAKLLERDRQLCSWDTGDNFQSSKYCKTRCSGSFTQTRSYVWYLRNSCSGVNAVQESRKKKELSIWDRRQFREDDNQLSSVKFTNKRLILTAALQFLTILWYVRKWWWTHKAVYLIEISIIIVTF